MNLASLLSGVAADQLVRRHANPSSRGAAEDGGTSGHEFASLMSQIDTAVARGAEGAAASAAAESANGRGEGEESANEAAADAPPVGPTAPFLEPSWAAQFAASAVPAAEAARSSDSTPSSSGFAPEEGDASLSSAPAKAPAAAAATDAANHASAQRAVASPPPTTPPTTLGIDVAEPLRRADEPPPKPDSPPVRSTPEPLFGRRSVVSSPPPSDAAPRSASAPPRREGSDEGARAVAVSTAAVASQPVAAPSRDAADASAVATRRVSAGAASPSSSPAIARVLSPTSERPFDSTPRVAAEASPLEEAAPANESISGLEHGRTAVEAASRRHAATIAAEPETRAPSRVAPGNKGVPAGRSRVASTPEGEAASFGLAKTAFFHTEPDAPLTRGQPSAAPRAIASAPVAPARSAPAAPAPASAANSVPSTEEEAVEPKSAPVVAAPRAAEQATTTFVRADAEAIPSAPATRVETDPTPAMPAAGPSAAEPRVIRQAPEDSADAVAASADPGPSVPQSATNALVTGEPVRRSATLSTDSVRASADPTPRVESSAASAPLAVDAQQSARRPANAAPASSVAPRSGVRTSTPSDTAEPQITDRTTPTAAPSMDRAEISEKSAPRANERVSTRQWSEPTLAEAAPAFDLAAPAASLREGAELATSDAMANADVALSGGVTTAPPPLPSASPLSGAEPVDPPAHVRVSAPHAPLRETTEARAQTAPADPLAIVTVAPGRRSEASMAALATPRQAAADREAPVRFDASETGAMARVAGGAPVSAPTSIAVPITADAPRADAPALVARVTIDRASDARPQAAPSAPIMARPIVSAAPAWSPPRAMDEATLDPAEGSELAFDLLSARSDGSVHQDAVTSPDAEAGGPLPEETRPAQAAPPAASPTIAPRAAPAPSVADDDAAREPDDLALRSAEAPEPSVSGAASPRRDARVSSAPARAGAPAEPPPVFVADEPVFIPEPQRESAPILAAPPINSESPGAPDDVTPRADGAASPRRDARVSSAPARAAAPSEPPPVFVADEPVFIPELQRESAPILAAPPINSDSPGAPDDVAPRSDARGDVSRQDAGPTDALGPRAFRPASDTIPLAETAATVAARPQPAAEAPSPSLRAEASADVASVTASPATEEPSSVPEIAAAPPSRSNSGAMGHSATLPASRAVEPLAAAAEALAPVGSAAPPLADVVAPARATPKPAQPAAPFRADIAVNSDDASPSPAIATSTRPAAPLPPAPAADAAASAPAARSELERTSVDPLAGPTRAPSAPQFAAADFVAPARATSKPAQPAVPSRADIAMNSDDASPSPAIAASVRPAATADAPAAALPPAPAAEAAAASAPAARSEPERTSADPLAGPPRADIAINSDDASPSPSPSPAIATSVRPAATADAPAAALLPASAAEAAASAPAARSERERTSADPLAGPSRAPSAPQFAAADVVAPARATSKPAQPAAPSRADIAPNSDDASPSPAMATSTRPAVTAAHADASAIPVPPVRAASTGAEAAGNEPPARSELAKTSVGPLTTPRSGEPRAPDADGVEPARPSQPARPATTSSSAAQIIDAADDAPRAPVISPVSRRATTSALRGEIADPPARGAAVEMAAQDEAAHAATSAPSRLEPTDDERFVAPAPAHAARQSAPPPEAPAGKAAAVSTVPEAARTYVAPEEAREPTVASGPVMRPVAALSPETKFPPLSTAASVDAPAPAPAPVAEAPRAASAPAPRSTEPPPAAAAPATGAVEPSTAIQPRDSVSDLLRSLQTFAAPPSPREARATTQKSAPSAERRTDVEALPASESSRSSMIDAAPTPSVAEPRRFDGSIARTEPHPASLAAGGAAPTRAAFDASVDAPAIEEEQAIAEPIGRIDLSAPSASPAPAMAALLAPQARSLIAASRAGGTQPGGAATTHGAADAAPRSGAAAKTLTIELAPESLGAVVVKMKIAHSGVDMKISVGSQEALHKLETSRAALVEAMQAVGCSIDGCTIQIASAPTPDSHTPDGGGFFASSNGAETDRGDRGVAGEGTSDGQGSGARRRDDARDDGAADGAPRRPADRRGGGVYL
jgi:hypothetical protein